MPWGLSAGRQVRRRVGPARGPGQKPEAATIAQTPAEAKPAKGFGPPLFLALIFISGGGALSAAASAQSLSADEILDRVDRNAVPKTMIATSEMTVHGRRSSRTIRAKSWVEGDNKAFTEYLSPPREKGVKMLKLGDQLWTYSPSTDRTISISGHMLRQSVMGSDLSYEDMMENDRLRESYAAAVAGGETWEGRPCWVLELTAAKDDVAYHRRKVWVDRERYVVLREERYAKSGRLLKTFEVRSVERLGGRWVQTHAVFKDALKTGGGTEFKIESVEFDVQIPAHIFDKASLRK
ncbi:MAG: outer membrane lipoprotein-sorting protein [Candidatus Aminicenantes bacterium]|nr:outer membrane lipoprotein-sorting protein [Candidatus Aminicenantes bacterium]